jgi:hypothetical protein
MKLVSHVLKVKWMRRELLVEPVIGSEELSVMVVIKSDDVTCQ